MKPLPNKFRKDGFNFCLVKRENDVAILSKEKNGIESYEICYVEKRPERIMGGVTIPAMETLPSDSTWGSRGFTATDLPSAQIRFEKLLKESSEKKSSLTEINLDGVYIPKQYKRGRKSLNINLEFPQEKFTIQDLADKYGVSKTYILLKLKDHKSVKVVDKKINGRGKPTNIYQNVLS